VNSASWTIQAFDIAVLASWNWSASCQHSGRSPLPSSLRVNPFCQIPTLRCQGCWFGCGRNWERGQHHSRHCFRCNLRAASQSGREYRGYLGNDRWAQTSWNYEKITRHYNFGLGGTGRPNLDNASYAPSITDSERSTKTIPYNFARFSSLMQQRSAV